MSCCTLDSFYNNTDTSFNKEEKALDKARSSIVIINSITEIEIFDKTSSLSIAKESYAHIGSGSVIKHTKTGSFILTASHVCDVKKNDQIKIVFPYFNPDNYFIITKNKHFISDLNGNKYIGFTLSQLTSYDTCIILSSKINVEPLPISAIAPATPQRGYLLGYPAGIWNKKYVPIFVGFYAGEIQIEKTRISASYSIPASPGTSGGPVINVDGKIIGMIHSYLQNYPSLSLSATLEQINITLSLAETTYLTQKSKYDAMCLGMDKKINILTSTTTDSTH